jgi:hypothetical protein
LSQDRRIPAPLRFLLLAMFGPELVALLLTLFVIAVGVLAIAR